MARAATRTRGTTTAGKASKKTVRVDFTGVETASVVPEGEYITTVMEAKLDESEGGNEYIAWKVQIKDGKYAKKTLYQNTSLQTQSLWATKKWLENLGLEIPEGSYDIDFDEVKDLDIGVVVEHDTYKGRTRSKIIDSFPAEEVAGEAEEAGEIPTDEEVDEMDKAALAECVETLELGITLKGVTSAQRTQVKEALEEKRAEVGGEEEAGELPSEGDIGGMSKEELAAVVEAHGIDVELTGTTVAQRRQLVAAIAALAEAGEIEYPEDDAIDAMSIKELAELNTELELGLKLKGLPKAQRAQVKEAIAELRSGGEKVALSAVNAMTEAELAECIEANELDVELGSFNTIRKKRSAVVDALEAAEKLEDDS